MNDFDTDSGSVPRRDGHSAVTGAKPSAATILLSAVLAIAVVGAGVLGAMALVKTSPKTERKQPERTARIVAVTPAEVRDVHATVTAMGTVTPARQVNLRPQVSGEVTHINPELIPGGLLEAGEIVLRVDPADYELAVPQRRAEVARAEQDLKIESGNQAIARREYELLGEVIEQEDRELILREPQQAAARAALESAAARLEQAQLDLRRTTVTAPFNALVQEKLVDLGTQVSPSMNLASVVGTDEYWVEVHVPVDQLKWIDIPRRRGDTASVVKVYNDTAWGAGRYVEGTVLRLAGDLAAEGRLARLIVSVKDPLGLEDGTGDRPTLLIGAYVRVEIEGRMISSAVTLTRDLLREGNRVWVLDDNNALDIRVAVTGFRSRDFVVIEEGLEPGEQVITTDLSAPVAGMPLRLEATPDIASSDKPGSAGSEGDGEMPK